MDCMNFFAIVIVNILIVADFGYKTAQGEALSGSDVGSISDSVISDEHPIEDYYDEGEIKKDQMALRSIILSCRRKVQKFCLKACRRCYRYLCHEYNCRYSIRNAFRKACERRCSSRY